MAEETYQHKSSCNSGCDEFIDTNCIVHKESIDYLGLEAGATTTEILAKLTQTVEYLQQQINKINNSEAPTAPTNLVATNITSSSTDLSWTKSTDNVEVTSYNIYQDGVIVANVETISAAISGLTASSTYTFAVSALDAVGNESVLSTSISVTTLA